MGIIYQEKTNTHLVPGEQYGISSSRKDRRNVLHFQRNGSSYCGATLIIRKGHAWATRVCPFCNIQHIQTYEKYKREEKDLILYRKRTKKKYKKKTSGKLGKSRRLHADLIFLIARKRVPLKIAARMLSLSESVARNMISESQRRIGFLVLDYLKDKDARIMERFSRLLTPLKSLA